MTNPHGERLIADRFRIEREVGRGAAGVVYRANDGVTSIDVALKVLTSVAHVGEHDRLSREGGLLAELDHPGIVRVVAFGVFDEDVVDDEGRRFEAGAPYIAMEWLAGEDLAERQRHTPLEFRDAVEVGRQMASALSAAHAAGILHRDIKPSNILLLHPHLGAHTSEPLRAKLVDFGVAAASDMRLTEAGNVVGTPAYMAPEQARGDGSTDVRSDIYSLGATLFELLTGRPPHIGPTSIATLARLVTTPAPRLSELLVEVPPALDELVCRMLSSNAADRPASASVVEAELARLLEDHDALPLLMRIAPMTERAHSATGTRLVTTLVALNVGEASERVAEIERLRTEGADAYPLGVDSLVAHLGMQRAHGDEAARALAIGHQLCASKRTKVGVATGKMRLDGAPSAGQVVDRAAALAREAVAGELLADATTTELARGKYHFRAIAGGASRVGPANKSGDGGSAAPFVGRESELAMALAAYERCAVGCTPVVVSVSGPPGIGKTRLAREFIGRVLSGEDAPRVIDVRCESYGRAQALGVANDALRSLLGLSRGASLEAAEAAISARRSDPANGLLACLLANRPFPAGIEPQGARDTLYVSMTELVLDAAKETPCAILVEDAQWSDPESAAWLDHLLGRAGGHPLFVVLLMRPSFWRNHGQRFLGREHVRVELRPIARKAARQIARAVIGPAATDEMLDQVAQQAAGSPLFAEELSRVIASGKDVAKAPTIEAAIQVSFDALDDLARDAIVRASIFGLSLWDTGLGALGVPEPMAALGKLVAEELLVEHPRPRFPNTHEFVFKHALVRDVVYASAGEELHRELHAAAAGWLAAMGEDAATVAQHFDLGGRHEEAAGYWEAAARRALSTNSLADAAAMADRALTFASDKPTAFARAYLLDEAYCRLDPRASDRDTAIRAMSENVFDEASELATLGARARYDDAHGSGADDIEERLTLVRNRARELGLHEEEARCSATLAHRYAFAGHLALAEQEAAHLLALGDQQRMVGPAVDAWQALAVVHQTRGELVPALEARRNAVRAAAAAGLQEREAMLTINVGFALTTIGAAHEARSYIETGLAKAHAIGSPGAVRHGQMNLLGWAATFGADPDLDAELAEPRASADEAATGGWTGRDRVTLGVLFYRGCELLRDEPSNLPRARALLKAAAEAYRSTENRDVLPVALGFWAEAERRFGRAEQAVEIAQEATRLLEEGAPSLLNEAPVYLALHDACVDVGDLTGARNALARGLVPLLRRTKGLTGTPYARTFLVGLPHNASLLATCDAVGAISPEIDRLLSERESPRPTAHP